MKWLLLLTLGGTGAVIVTACVVVLLVLHRLHRRNRVRPTQADEISLFWLISPQPAARLHRRLVASAHSVQVVAERHRPVGRRQRRQSPPTIVVLCEQLEAHAAALDAHLAFATRLAPGPRRQVLASLPAGVAEVERAAARIAVMSTEISTPRVLVDEVDGLDAMSTHLDSLELAHATLRELEAGAGLRPPSFPQVGFGQPATLPRQPERSSTTR